MQVRTMIEKSKVMELSMRKSWSLKGNNRQYEAMLNKIENISHDQPTTMALLEEIAKDIMEHSHIEEMMDETGMNEAEILIYFMGVLYNNCCYHFICEEK